MVNGELRFAKVQALRKGHDDCLHQSQRLRVGSKRWSRAVLFSFLARSEVRFSSHEEGILDASFGQIISFASFHQTSVRVEVPLANSRMGWLTAPRRRTARETPVDKGPSPRSGSNATERPVARTDGAEANADEETTEEESYTQPLGKDASPLMSLQQRAAQTFSKRSVADYDMQVARWLLRPSRGSWHLLSKHRRYTVTSLALLRVHFDRTPLHRTIRQKEALLRPTCKARLCTNGNVNRVIPTGYLAMAYRFRARKASAEISYFSPNRLHR